MLLLTALATLLIVYVIYAATLGEIRALDRVERDESPQKFWAIVLVYATIGCLLLALA